MSSAHVESDGGTFQKTVLRNGLRVVTERLPSVRSISLGVWIDVGSRNEAKSEYGISHLIEHMLFKGTRRRNAREIASALESIGGSINAFTSREQTCYTARILDEHLPIAIDVLSDLTTNATITAGNLAKEKKVICEEIKESFDTPSDRIHDIFAKTYWGNHALGSPILGSIDNVTNMPRKKVLDYIKRNYKSGSIVIAAAGSVSHDKLVRLVRKNFDFPTGAVEYDAPPTRTKSRTIDIVADKNNQTHLVVGFPGLDYSSPSKMASLLLNTYLGGGMSSVLFQKIREERGLAYTVYMFHDFYRDAGIVGTYVGTDKTRVALALDIILKEFRKLKRNRLKHGQLSEIKAQLKGQLMLGMEATTSRMSRLARQELMIGKYYTLDHILKSIEKVSANDILELCNQLFDESQMAVSVLGPTEKSALDNVIG